MRPITPVHADATGDAVSNLHKGLLFLIMHEPRISDNDRRSLQQQLAPELKTETFGKPTLRSVTWQHAKVARHGKRARYGFRLDCP